jgi:hypothetical protein
MVFAIPSGTPYALSDTDGTPGYIHDPTFQTKSATYHVVVYKAPSATLPWGKVKRERLDTIYCADPHVSDDEPRMQK